MINIHPSKNEIEKGKVNYIDLYEHNIIYDPDYHLIILGGSKIYRGFKHGLNCFIGHNTVVREGVTIGDNVKIGSLCSIERNVTIGDNTNIQAGCFIGEFTNIGHHNFMGPHTVITSDKYPPGSHNPVTIGDYNIIGAHSTIIPGTIIKDYIIIAMGSRVTKNKLEPGVYIDDKFIYDINTYHNKRAGKSER